MPYFLFDRAARRRHADRRRPVGAAVAERDRSAPTRRRITSSSSCRSTRRRRQVNAQRQRRRLRELGAHAALQEGLDAQPRAAGDRAVAHRAADQHADLGAGAQSRTTGRSTPRATSFPTSTDRDDARREPRGAQPARHRRRVRPAGAPHRPRQAAGHPREPASRATTRSISTSALNGVGHDAASSTRATTADPEIAKWLTNADFRRALSLGIDRDQLNETFWLGVGTPGSTAPAESAAAEPGPGMAQQVVDATIRPRPTRCSTRSASTKKDARGLPRCAPTTASGCASRSRRCRRFLPWPQQIGDDRAAMAARSASRPTCARWSACSP